MGGVRHSGASHPLIILLSSFLPDTPSDRPRVPLSPHDEEFLDVVLLHPERSSRPRTYTHTFEVERPKKRREKELIPIHDLPFLSVPNFPLSSFFLPRPEVSSSSSSYTLQPLAVSAAAPFSFSSPLPQSQSQCDPHTSPTE